MTVAEMVGGARERQRIGRADEKHRFVGGGDAHEPAIVGNEHVAVGEHGAARQHERDFLAVVERGGEAALAACVVGEGQRRRARDERTGDDGGSDAFIDRAHD